MRPLRLLLLLTLGVPRVSALTQEQCTNYVPYTIDASTPGFTETVELGANDFNVWPFNNGANMPFDVIKQKHCDDASFDGDYTTGVMIRLENIPDKAGVSISTCTSPSISTLDTDLAVYSGVTPGCGENLLFCSGDEPADKDRCQLGHSRVNVPYRASSLVAVVGGYMGATGRVRPAPAPPISSLLRPVLTGRVSNLTLPARALSAGGCDDLRL